VNSLNPVFSIVIADTMPALEECLSRTEGFLSDHGIPRGERQDIRLSLEEVVTNILKYGYGGKDGGDHSIEIEVSVTPTHLALKISDQGGAFNPLEHPDPRTDLPAEKRPIGGLGLQILKSVMESIHYKREGNKNILLLRKSRTGSSGGSGG
jgi:anti-sigma regulatory factor (Ser/Thr protein kinase)